MSKLKTLYFLFFFISFIQTSFAFSRDAQKVLILHSYHQGFTWTDEINDGILQTFNSLLPDAEITIEYMNAKRVPSKVIFPLLLNMYEKIYRKSRFNVIIVSDNNAFDFLLKFREKLFPNVPVVFCGINNINEYDLNNYRDFKGVTEEIDAFDTIKIALKFHPKTTKIAAVSDLTQTGQINLKITKEAANKFPSIQFLDFSGFPPSELRKILGQLKKDTIIMKVGYVQDLMGQLLSEKDSTQFIADATDLPVYTLWRFYLGPGVVGGRLVSGTHQGISAAGIAIRILKGEKPENIPIQKSPTAYFFDYSMLHKFNIPESLLPVGSIILGKPTTFYSRYRTYIWICILIIASQSIIIIILRMNIKNRRREETARKKAEEKYRLIYENAVEGIFQTTPEGRAISSNPALARILAYDSPEEAVESLTDIRQQLYVHPEERDALISSLIDMGSVVGHEVEFYRKDKKSIWVSLSVRIVRDDSGKPLLLEGFLYDISKRKFAEAELKTAIEEQKNIEKALRESEELYRVAIQGANDGVVILKNAIHVFVNEQFLAMFGYDSFDEISELPPFFTVHPDDRERVAGYSSARQLGENIPHRYDFKGIKKNGAVIYVEVSVNMITYKGEKAILTFLRDITERKLADEALRASGQQMKAIIDGSPIPQFVIGKDHRIIHWNKALEMYSGIKAEDMVGTNKQWRAFYSKERPCMADLIVNGEIESIPQWYEGKYSHSRLLENAYEAIDFFSDMKGGTWLDFTAAPIYDAAGSIIGAVETLTDITDRMRIAKALESSHHELKRHSIFLEALFSTLPIPIFYKDTEGRYLGCNANYTEIMGITPKELKEKTAFDLWPEEFAKEYHKQDVELLQNPGIQIYEYKIRNKSGEIRDVIFRKSVYKDEDNRIKGIIGAFFDITEQKRIEKLLKLNADRLDALLKINQMTETTIQEILDFSFEAAIRLIESEIGYLAFINDDETVMTIKQWSRRTMTECEMIEKPYDFHIPSLGLLGEVVRHKKPVIINDYSAPNQLKKGYPEGHLSIKRFMNIPVIKKSKVVLVAGVANKSEDYNETDVQQLILLMEGMWRVIERKIVEDEMKTLQTQLVQAQKMESVGRLAGGVAHDFNNMVGVILGYTELAIAESEVSQILRVYLEEIRKSAQRSADLTRQLLAFARKQPIAPRVLDLNEIIDSILKILRRLIGEEIDLVWIPGTDLWQVKIDPSQVDQLLANLCVNARDAIAGVGRVTIETNNIELDEDYCSIHQDFSCGEYVMLAVSDDGCGISKDLLDHLFEPFFTTKEMGKGTGLGLATVYGIVKQNEGFINVYSEVDKGSTFKIYLPRFAGEAEKPSAELQIESAKGQKEVVLLVEDDTAMLNVIQGMLEKLGYTVLTASGPSEALRKAKEYISQIQLLIADVVMPEMNGRELAKLLTDMKPGLKCLFASGCTANVIAHRGVLDEGVNFIQKPFSMQALASKLREVLESQ